MLNNYVSIQILGFTEFPINRISHLHRIVNQNPCLCLLIHLHIRKQVNIKVKNPEFIESFFSVLLMDNVNKKEFATIFTKNYASIVKDFIEVRIILYLYSQSFTELSLAKIFEKRGAGRMRSFLELAYMLEQQPS